MREEGGRIVIEVGDLPKGPAGFATVDVALSQNLTPGSVLRNTAGLRDGFGNSVEAEDLAVLRSSSFGRISCAFRAQVYARPGSPIRYVVRYKNGGGNNSVTVSLPPELVQIKSFSQPPDVWSGSVFRFTRLAKTAGSIRIDTAVDAAVADGTRLFSWATVEDELGNLALCEHRSEVRRLDRLALFLHGTSKVVAGGNALYTARYMNAGARNELRIVIPPEFEVLSTFPAPAQVMERTWVFRDLPAPSGVVKIRVRASTEAPAGTVQVGAAFTDESAAVSATAQSTIIVR